MHAWIDARQRHRLSLAEVQAVRCVGLIQSRERSVLARRRRSGLGGSSGQSGMGAWLISSPRSLATPARRSLPITASSS